MSMEYRVPSGGGLYIASLGTYKAAIIVPPKVKGLADLQCQPQIDVAKRTPETITMLIACAQLWGKARLSGDFIAGVRRTTVLRAITAHILALLGGSTWAYAESKLEKRGLIYLSRSISEKPGELRFVSKLQFEYQSFAGAPPAKRAACLAELAQNFRIVQPSPKQREVVGKNSSGMIVRRRVQGVGPDNLTWLAEFALRMASDPGTLSTWAGDYLSAGVGKLLNVPILVRAARFLVLAVDQQKKSFASTSEVYAGWGWSE